MYLKKSPQFWEYSSWLVEYFQENLEMVSEVKNHLSGQYERIMI